MIIQNTKNYKKKVDTAPVEELHTDTTYSYNLDDSPTEKDEFSDFIDEYVDYCTQNIYKLFPKEKDAQVADAILELFRKREVLDLFNKKALYLLIREMVDVKTPHITRIADQLGDIFKFHYLFYSENGYTNFN